MTDREWLFLQRGLMAVTIATMGIAFPIPAGAGQTTDRVRSELDQITAVVKDPALQGAAKEEERKAKVKRLILRWFDVQEMARRSLDSHWAKRSEAERKEFIGLFGDLFVESYTRLVVDHLSDQRVVYLSEADDGAKATVRTKFLSKRGEPTFVDFSLLRRDDAWSAYDVVIDDVSIVGTYRGQFNKIIHSQSYEALLKKMRIKHEAEGLGSTAKGAQ